MEKRKILVVDDEQGIRDIMKEYMVLEDYEILEAADGVEGINMFRNHSISLVVLDIMLPKMDGWSVCREIRKESQVPIIMLTARGEEYDKLFGFELGVDDYMVKPFSPRELLARIKAILNRSQNKQEAVQKDIKKIKDFTIDFDGRNVSIGDKSLSLTPKEYELLQFFVKNPNKVFSRDQLLNQVWGYDFVGDARTVDTHVKMLRESLEHYRKWIVTVWGIGYKFQSGEDE